jgi:hypothetical protein
MGQGLLVIEHRTKIAHVEITTAQFALPKMFGLAQRRSFPRVAERVPLSTLLNISKEPIPGSRVMFLRYVRPVGELS